MEKVTSTATPEQVLRDIDERSRRRFLPIIGPAKGRLLEEVVARHRPMRVLEVGTLVGYSAILMARRLPSGGKILTLEANPRAVETATENLQRAGLADRVEIVSGDARRTIPTLEGPFDLVFLDGTKEEYLDYLRLVEPMIPQGGVVVADNAGMFALAMAPYLEYVRDSARYRSQYHDFGSDGVEVSIKL
jgi:predicted O-methyltransferase YrrM